MLEMHACLNWCELHKSQHQSFDLLFNYAGTKFNHDCFMFYAQVEYSSIIINIESSKSWL